MPDDSAAGDRPHTRRRDARRRNARRCRIRAAQLRLPDTVVPTNYELQLTLDPDADEYAGAVRIGIRIAVPIDLVWINATRLQFDDVVAVVDSGASAGLRAEVIPGNDDVVGLQFASPLPAGTATLTVHFTGRFSASEVAGLFKQKEAGDWYVLTQMEPLWARRAFPCFDEPRFRAPWQITLTVPEHQRAFSNMPVESERVAHSGWREVRFQQSPSMATYLVAIAVGPFDVLDGGIAGRNATPLRYIAPKGRAAEAAYAASITPRILERLEAYFGQPFPFPKLDSISIPNSGYTFGAMENIGLITYDQSLLLAKPEETTTRFQQSYVSVAAHEISHQWFGDLVTPLWWNDIWLNESFASWLGDKITGEVKPEWRWDFRRIDGRAWAITSDRLASARRIRQPIEVRSDVRSAFDGISYSKGQSVLAMFENWLGPDKFRAGVRRYMAQHAWGVATADDFFAALVAEDDALLPAFRDFVDRSGVPILTIALDCASGARLVLSQKRFLPRGSTGDPAQRWVFPACFEYGDATKAATQCTLIKDEASELGLNTKSCPQWVIGNRGAIGYFLPALSPQLYAAVANAGLLIGPTDWYALLSDSDILARSAAVPLPDALSLAALASAQKDPRVFGAAVGVAEGVPRALTTGAEGIRYAAWARGRSGLAPGPSAGSRIQGRTPTRDGSAVWSCRSSPIAVATRPSPARRGSGPVAGRRIRTRYRRMFAVRSSSPPPSRRGVTRRRCTRTWFRPRRPSETRNCGATSSKRSAGSRPVRGRRCARVDADGTVRPGRGAADPSRAARQRCDARGGAGVARCPL